MTQRSTKPAIRHVIACLFAAFALWTAAIWLGRQYPLPSADTNLFFLPVRDQAVAWLLDPHNEKPEWIHKLDLQSGKVSHIPLRTLAFIGVSNSRGERVVIDDEVEVIDDSTGQVLWSGPKPCANPVLVGDHYLVQSRTDSFRIFDIDKMRELPGILEMQDNPYDAIVSVHTVPGAKWPGNQDQSALRPIEGTSRFLYRSGNATQGSVRVFEINDRELNEIASWLPGETAIVMYDNCVWTATQSGAEVEVRSLDDYQVVRTLPLPTGLKAWTNGLMGVRGGVFSTRNGLFCFVDDKTGICHTHRLDDFSAVTPAGLYVTLGGIETSTGDDRRYVILSDNTSPYSSRQIYVYDSTERRMAANRNVPVGLQVIGIVDGRLVLVNEAMGLTVEMIDLATGATTVLRPLAWVLWLMPLLLFASLVWLVVWIRLTANWPRWAIANALLVIALFVTPQLVHAFSFGGAMMIVRPAVSYCFLVLLVLFFYGAAYLAFGQRPVLLRSVPVCLGVAAIVGLANFYVNDIGQRGLLAMQDRSDSSMAALCLRMLVVFSLTAVVVLGGLRLLWFRSKRRQTGDSTPNAKSSSPAISLRDIFVFTACVAALVAAVAPNREFFMEPATTIGALIVAVLLVGVALLGFASMARSAAVYRVMSIFAIVLGLFAIIEITFSLCAAHQQREIGNILLMVLRFPLFMFLATFAVGALLRPKFRISDARKCASVESHIAQPATEN